MATERAIDLNERIKAAREKRERDDREWEERNRRRAAASDMRHSKRKEFIKAHLRPATLPEYKDFLRGYMADGGEITYRKHSFRDEQREHFGPKYFVAVRDIAEFPSSFCGTLAFNVIVPRGVEAPRITTGSMPYGHCSVYFMDDFSLYGDTSVDVFSDISF